MVEVVKTNVGNIPLSEIPFKDIVRPLVTEEALALAKKHGFYLESDLTNPVIGLRKDKECENGTYYRALSDRVFITWSMYGNKKTHFSIITPKTP